MFATIIAISLISPLLGITFSLVNYSKYKNSISSAITIGFSFACSWYGYVPDQDNDIFRHVQIMHDYIGRNVFQIWGNYRQNTFTFDFWLWIISKFSNDRLLQASAAFVSFSILTYVVLDYSKHNSFEIRQTIVSLLISWTLMPWLDISIGIRTANSFVLCFFAIYIYYFKSKKILSILICVIAIFLHQASILVIIAWLLSPIFKKHKITISIAIIVTLFTFNNYGAYSSALSNSNSIFGQVFSDVFKSAETYQDYVITSLHALVTNIIQTAYAIVLLVRPYILSKETYTNMDYSNKTIESKFYDISLFMLVISVISQFLIGSNGNRYLMATSLLAFLPFMSSIKQLLLLENFNNYIDYLVVALSCGNLILYLYNMNWGTGSLMSWVIGFISGISFTWGIPFLISP